MPSEKPSLTINNRSSAEHNIITNEENVHSGALKQSLRLQQSHNRLKGVAEVREMLHISKTNANEDHKKAFEGNQRVFARKDGIFTHVYNSAARFGEDKVFKH